MGSLAFIFPGQGSQAVGMGKSLCAAFPESRAVIDEASAALSLDMQRLCFEGPEAALTLTAAAQPAILTVSVAALRAFAARSPLRPAVVAGHSLGEYSALVAAEVLDLGSAVRAVRARGTFMQEAVPPGEGAMAAVLGLPASTVREACEAVAGGDVVSPANYNEPMQTVIAGHAAAVERAREKLVELGAKRVIPLAVSAPFHCALMAPVVPRLSAVFAGTTFGPYAVPLIANVTAQSSSASDRTATLLLEQVTAPVRWVESVEEMVRLGVTRVIEFGPGRVLGGLTRRIAKGVECFNVEDEASLNKTLSALEGAA